MLTDRQCALVRDSWAQVAPLGATAASLFYDRLFTTTPALRPLFARADMVAQHDKLLHMLAVAVASLDRLDTLAPAVEALGRRHAGYGVRHADYPAVGDALLWTLEQALGARWTAETRTAWATAYELLAGIMRAAVHGGDVAPAPPPAGLAARGLVAGLALAGALAGALVGRPAAAQDIDTRAPTLLAAAVNPSFGQVFTAPAGATALQSFGLTLGTNGDGLSTYEVRLMAWSGTRATGPVLSGFGPLPAPLCCATPGHTIYHTFDLPVVAGQQYVAWVTPVAGSISVFFPSVGGTYADVYADGAFFINPCDDPTACHWFQVIGAPGADAAFTATFTFGPATTVPEPATLALLAPALGGLAACVRARRRARRAPA